MTAQDVWIEDVAAVLVYPDGRDVRLSPADFRFDSAPWTVETGSTLEGLLTQQGLVPEADAVEAFYRLNPSAQRAEVFPGQAIQLPVVRGASVSEARAEGARVALTLDLSLKQRFLERSATLGRLLPAASERLAGSADGAAVRADLDRAGRAVSALADAIVQRSLPMDRDVLWRSDAESGVLQEIAADIVEGVPPDGPRRERLSTVASSLSATAERLSGTRDPGSLPSRFPSVFVVVRVVNEDGGEEHRLRVYYQPPALEGSTAMKSSFATPTSPSTKSLPEARWRIWAVQPFDTLTPATEVLNVDVFRTQGDTLVVELLRRPPGAEPDPGPGRDPEEGG
ncbi:MAG: hypothetical protein P8177_07735 [Gemmatimonadota bacterium]